MGRGRRGRSSVEGDVVGLDPLASLLPRTSGCLGRVEGAFREGRYVEALEIASKCFEGLGRPDLARAVKEVKTRIEEGETPSNIYTFIELILRIGKALSS